MDRSKQQRLNTYTGNAQRAADDSQDSQWSDWAWDMAKGCDYRFHQNPDGTRVYEFRQMGSAAEDSRQISENRTSKALGSNGRSAGDSIVGAGTGAAGFVFGVAGTLLYTASYLLKP